MTFGIGFCITQLNNTSLSTGISQITLYVFLFILTAYFVAKKYQAIQVFRKNDLFVLETMISDLSYIAIRQEVSSIR